MAIRVSRKKKVDFSALENKSEHDIQNECLQWLSLFGHIGVRINSGAVKATYKSGKSRFIRFNDTPGCSDILACVKGFFIAIEVKRPKAKTDKLRLAKQIAFIESVKLSGGHGMIVTSLADMIGQIEAFLKSKGL